MPGIMGSIMQGRRMGKSGQKDQARPDQEDENRQGAGIGLCADLACRS